MDDFGFFIFASIRLPESLHETLRAGVTRGLLEPATPFYRAEGFAKEEVWA
jgi:hypothetical protein